MNLTSKKLSTTLAVASALTLSVCASTSVIAQQNESALVTASVMLETDTQLLEVLSNGTLTPPELGDSSIGQVFVNANKLTIYTFENDRNNTEGDDPLDSDCNAGCIVARPAHLASQDAVAQGEFTIIERSDNSRQWAFKGLPLYTFFEDVNPGDVYGEGLGEVWFVARPAVSTVMTSSLGDILVSNTDTKNTHSDGSPADTRIRQGHSLYVWDGDINDIGGDGIGDSDCNNDCAVAWPPLFAEKGATPTGNYSLIERDDGNLQWALSGEPLYYFTYDLTPGEQRGDQLNGWHLARTAPIQLRSDDVKGDIFTARGDISDVSAYGSKLDTTSDRTGFSVYTLEEDSPGISKCNADCAVAWPPLYAEASDVASNSFTIIEREDGTLQWAYNNNPLYLFIGDTDAGMVNGDDINSVWHLVNPMALCADKWQDYPTIYSGGDKLSYNGVNYQVVGGPLYGVTPVTAGHDHRYINMGSCQSGE